MARQDAWFDALLAERQALDSIAVDRAARQMGYDMTIATAGDRGDAYRLDWSARLAAYGETLVEGGADLMLEPGDNRARLPIDAWQIVERYHEVALNYRDADVEVAESFQLEVSLTPRLGPEDLARLPADEAQKLALGRSALIDAKSIDFPAHFRISGPEYELLD